MEDNSSEDLFVCFLLLIPMFISLIGAYILTLPYIFASDKRYEKEFFKNFTSSLEKFYDL